MTNIKKKKCISIVVISFIIFIIVIFSFNNITKYNSNKVDTNEKEITKSVSNTGDVHKDLITKLKYTDKIEVYHDYNARDISNIKPIETRFVILESAGGNFSFMRSFKSIFKF